MTARERDCLRKRIKAQARDLSDKLINPLSRHEIRLITNITLRNIDGGMKNEPAYFRAVDKFLLARRPKKFVWCRWMIRELWRKLSGS